MARYIDADLLLKDISESVVFSVRGSGSPELRGARKIIDRIENAPTADVVEVKHGEWIKGGSHYGCSECCTSILYNIWGYECYSDYCPHCGAKMDGGTKA